MKCVFFSSSFREMTYEDQLKQRMPLCETELNHIFAKNARLINCLNR